MAIKVGGQVVLMMGQIKAKHRPLFASIHASDQSTGVHPPRSRSDPASIACWKEPPFASV